MLSDVIDVERLLNGGCYIGSHRGWILWASEGELSASFHGENKIAVPRTKGGFSALCKEIDEHIFRQDVAKRLQGDEECHE